MLHNFSLFLLLPATLGIPLPAPSSPGLPPPSPPPRQKHVIDQLTQFAIHLHGRRQEVKKSSETKHSFLKFLICEIHGVFSKFSRKGLPYSKVGPPDLRYLISRECWHSAVNFGAVNESIVHFLDQVRFTFKRKTFKKTRYEKNSFNGHRVNCSRKKNITSLHLTYA